VLESTVSHWGGEGAQADRFQNFFLDRYAQAYRAELDHFVEVIAGRSPPAVGYRDGVRALELAEAADASARSGQSVKV
jgi:myo-inositol 2-dehydrogenase/D-chiro-inositol 1-dehydrogenase